MVFIMGLLSFCLSSPVKKDVYTSIASQIFLRRQRRTGCLCDCPLHACPASFPQLLSQPPLCGLPEGLSGRQLPPASPGKTEQTLPLVLSTPGANPTLL